MKNILLASLLASAVIGGADAQTRRRVDPEESLPEVMAEFQTAWNKHDAKAMVAVWHENGDFIDALGRRATGKEEIEALLAGDHAAEQKNTTITVKVLTYQALVRGIIFADAEATISGFKDAKGKDLPSRKYHIALTAMAKQGTLWLVNVRAYLAPRQ